MSIILDEGAALVSLASHPKKSTVPTEAPIAKIRQAYYIQRKIRKTLIDKQTNARVQKYNIGVNSPNVNIARHLYLLPLELSLATSSPAALLKRNISRSLLVPKKDVPSLHEIVMECSVIQRVARIHILSIQQQREQRKPAAQQRSGP